MIFYIYKQSLKLFLCFFMLGIFLHAEKDVFSPDITFNQKLTPQSNYSNSRIKNLQILYNKLQAELDLLAVIQESSGRKMITFGSARIRNFIEKIIDGKLKKHDYELAASLYRSGERIGELAFQEGLSIGTGAGPGTMEMAPKGWMKAFIKEILSHNERDLLIDMVKNEYVVRKMDISWLEVLQNNYLVFSEEKIEKLAIEVLLIIDNGLNPVNRKISNSTTIQGYTEDEIITAKYKKDVAEKFRDKIKGIMPRRWIQSLIANNIPDGESLQSLINIVERILERDGEEKDWVRAIKSTIKRPSKKNKERFARKVLAIMDDGLNPLNMKRSSSTPSLVLSQQNINKALDKLDVALQIQFIIDSLIKKNIRGHGAQGIKIKLPFEAESNPYILEEYNFTLFFTRKLALLSKSIGAINFSPGFGTMDEVFDSWVREVPMAFYGTYIWDPILNSWENSFKKAGFNFPQNIIVTDDPDIAFNQVMGKAQDQFADNSSYFADVAITRNIQKELKDLFPRYMLSEPAVVFVGEKPDQDTDERYSDNVNEVNEIAGDLLKQGYGVRVTSPDLLSSIYETAEQLKKEKLLQLVLRKTQETSVEDVYLKDDIEKNQKLFEIDNVLIHRILSSENSIGYVFSPGGINTINILFDVLTRMQTGKIDKKPIILIDPEFWLGSEENPGIFRIIKQMSFEFASKEDIFGVPLMLECDFDLLKFVKNKTEAMRCLTDYENYSFEKNHKPAGFLNDYKNYIEVFIAA